MGEKAPTGPEKKLGEVEQKRLILALGQHISYADAAACTVTIAEKP